MNSTPHVWRQLNAVLPFPSAQKVTIDAKLGADGKRTTKAKYVVRGDNELLLRVAFHQTQKKTGKMLRNFWRCQTASAGKSQTRLFRILTDA